MFSTDSGRDDAGPSACSSEGESLEIVAAGESEPLAIGVVYMKFFVDTADVAEIKDLAASGLLDGVTTNPSLIMKAGRPMLDVIQEICAIVPGPVSAETVATDHKKMLEEGRKLARLAKNVAVKVPLTPDGLKTCKVLSSEGTMVNVTLCFSAAQALLAAKAGATFISPFVGRLDDIGQDGMHLIGEIMTIYRQYPHFKTEVLVASIRHTQHVIAAAKLGAHVGTLPPNVLRQLFKHTLTDNGLKAFLDDWAKTGQSIL
jgi:transaldolase